jgi:hypothetical protein
MSFKNKIEESMESAIQSSLNLQEATLKIGMFTGKVENNKTAEKLGIKIKVVSAANPGNNVVFTGSEEALLKYARKYLGAVEGDTLADVARDVAGPGGVTGGDTKEANEAKKEDMDPVGKEDDDVDNDGDSDSSDEYLKKKRAAIAKTMNKDKLKELAKASKK